MSGPLRLSAKAVYDMASPAPRGRGPLREIVELHAGDVVFAPDGEEHRHGATPDHFMTHLSITEGAPNWRAHVTDAEYRGQPPVDDMDEAP
jgi:hypothetical protein